MPSTPKISSRPVVRTPSSTASPSGWPPRAGLAHDRRRHDAAHASASTAGARSASASSITSVEASVGVEPRHADHGGLVAELAQQAVGRALERGTGDDRRHRHASVASSRDRVTRTPGTASTGSIDTSGFDGAITTSVGRLRSRRARPGRACADVGAVEAHAGHRHRVAGGGRSTPGTPISPSPATVTTVRRRSSVTGSRTTSEAPRPADLGGHLAQAWLPRTCAGSVQVGAEVAVAEVEPRHARRSAGATPSPARISPARPHPVLGVDRASERVRDRVEIRTDVQPVQLEVVADIADRGDLGRRRRPASARRGTGPLRLLPRRRRSPRDPNGAPRSLRSGDRAGRLARHAC